MIALLALLLTTSAAYGETLHQWYESAHTCTNIHCCGVADASPYYDGYTLNKDGSVQLDNGRHIDACQVQNGPNLAGHAVIWMDGAGRVMCFAPGSGT
jgi:hypothetical protein